MPSGSILFSGKIPFENIHILFSEERFSYPQDHQSKIDTIWEEKLLESQKQGKLLWDGTNYRLIEFVYENGFLELKLGLIKYRNIRLAQYVLNNSSLEKSGNGIFVAGCIRSSDGYFIFGKRSGLYFGHQGNTVAIGGMLQFDEIHVDSIDNIFDGLAKEIYEEMGVPRDCIIYKDFIGCLRGSSLGNVGLIFFVQLDQTRSEILERFHVCNDGEMEELVFVPREDLKSFGQQQNSGKEDKISLYVEILEKYLNLL